MVLRMKLTFGIIVLNGDFLLRQVLDSIYPVAHSICIAEGSVSWWNENGIITSNDDTNKILSEYPDPENKIKIVHGTWVEKTEQCQAWFELVPDDTDYVICNDSDEIHSYGNLIKLIDYLEKEQPISLGFKSDSFFGGFERVIGGFEALHDFIRVLKYFKGSKYHTHRQPCLSLNDNLIKGKHITGNQLFKDTGVTMWHGSYISPKQVYEKIQYYETAVISKGNCIPNYFKDVYLEWVNGCDTKRMAIENKWKGVQEFMPHTRGACFTEKYKGKHPEIIMRDMSELITKFDKQLQQYARL